MKYVDEYRGQPEAARFLESALPEPEFWDVLPEEQTAQSAPARVIEFLTGA